MVVVQTKTFLKYTGLALLLFATGSGLAWASEQSWFSKEVVSGPVGSTSPSPSAPATPSAVPDPEASALPGRAYTVQPGDTISSIATANGLDFETLAEYNSIPYPYNLTVGQTIYIPE